MMPSPTVASLAADLVAEQAALDVVVGGLTEAQWHLATPSPGWTVADQIGHLQYFDGTATNAIMHPEVFAAQRDELVAASLNHPDTADALTLGPWRAMTVAARREQWRAQRNRLALATTTLTDDQRIDWYGPSMGAKSFLTARLMETWAHGQDVVDALAAAGLKASRPATDRLRHIAQLGVITRRWSYLNRGLEMPAEEVGVELLGPSGDLWRWGGNDNSATVRGLAEHFCLVVTQRRHRDDTDLAVTGAAAADWLDHAQAFAGGPTTGPPATHPR